MKRILNFIMDIFVNGIVLYGAFLIFSFGFYSFSPTDWYFTYSSVEPVASPVEIDSDYILMESTLEVLIDGNLRWNDVLRCRQLDGLFTFYSQYDTSADMVYRGAERKTQWEYRGYIPDNPSVCRMDSTITRVLPFGIEKQQTLSSKEFIIQ